MSVTLLTWAKYISQLGSQTVLSKMKKQNTICSVAIVVPSSPDIEIVSN